MKLKTRFVVVICIAVLIAPPAYGWNDLGHRLVAAIAYARLSSAERQKVFEILQTHPHFAVYLSKEPPPGIDQKEWAFWNAATWADWVRVPYDFQGNVATDGRYKFHRGNWHYVNFPYKLHQQDLTISTPLPASTDIMKQIAASDGILRGTIATDPETAQGVTAVQNKSVRLCWLFHLVGDLHQPLHVAALVEPTKFPDGDQGGNLLAVRRDANSQPEKLHGYWDGILGRDSSVANIRTLQASFEADPALADPALIELTSHPDVKQWVQESFEAAARRAYLNGDLPLVSWKRFDDGLVATEDVPAFTADNRAMGEALARKRVVLAGIRLANMLKAIVNEEHAPK